MRIVFMGTPEAAVPSLQRCLADGHEVVAVWTQPDKPAGRGNKLHQSPVKEFAVQHNLTVHQASRIKTDEAKALFALHNTDAAVVVAYGKILPAEFLNAPAYGCINVHFSLLPKYRGAAPVNWAIVNGEKETGVTTMRIVEELDAGPILLQRATGIGEHETAPELMTRLSHIGAALLSETLTRLESLGAEPQRDEDATFAPVLRREDGLIDWSMDGPAIERRVRGHQPWPNAYTMHSSGRVILWKAAPEINVEHSAEAGQIIDASADRLVVACGNATTLRIFELQHEGKRRMSAREFLNGARLKPRDAFGTRR